MLEYNDLFNQHDLGSSLYTNLSAGSVQIELPEIEMGPAVLLSQSLWVLKIPALERIGSVIRK